MYAGVMGLDRLICERSVLPAEEGVKHQVLELNVTHVEGGDTVSDRMSEENRKEGKDKCPLSSKDWVMFLSDEMRHEEMRYFMSRYIVAVFISIIAVMIVAAFTFSSVYHSIFGCCYSLIPLLVLVTFVWKDNKVVKSTLKKLEKLRGEVITGGMGDRRGDSDKICKQWEEMDSAIRKREEKLVFRKRGDKEGEKNGLEENDCPLSPKDWIFFLSSESHKLTEIALVFFVIFIATYTAASNEIFSPQILWVIFVIMSYPVFILLTCFLIKTVVLSFRMDKIIEEILHEKLTDCKEIRKRWKRGKKIWRIHEIRIV